MPNLKNLSIFLNTMMALLLTTVVAPVRAENLPDPKTAAAGKPINLLVVSSQANKVNLIDPTAAAVKGLKPLKTTITVPAGASVEVK